MLIPDPHLVLDVSRFDVIWSAETSIGVDFVFRDNENGDALGSRWVPFDSGKDWVNDIFGQVMVPEEIKHLVPVML